MTLPDHAIRAIQEIWMRRRFGNVERTPAGARGPYRRESRRPTFPLSQIADAQREFMRKRHVGNFALIP
jgi:hypothetical protein